MEAKVVLERKITVGEVIKMLQMFNKNTEFIIEYENGEDPYGFTIFQENDLVILRTKDSL